MIQVGVIGYGYWGPQIARNFHSLEDCEVSVICDKSPAAQGRIQRAYPQARATCDVSEALCSPHIDAVAVVTPVWTHFELTKRALENGKHVFVEKPFTSTAAQAEELIELAREEASDHHGRSHLPVHRRSQEDRAVNRRRHSWASSTTTIQPGSTWGFSSTTLTSSGTWRLTTFPSWTTS